MKVCALPRQRNWCFTLIELLVVIAIIAILASILLPALRKAMDTTKRISCVNNQKQMSIAVGEYAGDHDSYMMWCYYAATSECWIYYMVDYIVPQKETSAYICPAYSPTHDGTRNPEYMDCYSFIYNSDNKYLSTYSYNYEIGASHTVDYPLVKLNRLKNPSSTVCISDGVLRTGYSGTNVYYMCHSFLAQDPTIFFGRHSGSENLLFCDGHSEAFKPVNIDSTWWDTY